MSVRKLSPELQELAIKEINEDPKRIPEDLEYIREWLAKQPHLKTRTDDQFLLTFLRGSKFSLERTKEKLDMHYTLKTITPEIYNNRDPLSPEIQRILSFGPMLVLPKLASPTSPRYMFARNGVTEKHKLDQADLFKVGTMIQDILLLEDDVPCVSGMVIVHDMSETSMAHVLTLSPVLTKKAMTCFQQGYPVRIKGAHFFNITPAFERINALFRPFLSEKLKQRMRVHSSFEVFCQHIPKEVLPKEYGGDGGKIEDLTVYWKEKIESYREWFLEDDNYRTDEKKRPGKPKTSESVFGLEGSFRQLSVD